LFFDECLEDASDAFDRKGYRNSVGRSYYCVFSAVRDIMVLHDFIERSWCYIEGI